MTAQSVEALTFRRGEHADLRTTFSVAEVAVHDTARRMGVLTTEPPSEEQIEGDWQRRRDLLEFTAAQNGGGFWVCEDEGRPVGYGRVCQFGEMEQLTELMVLPESPPQRHRPCAARSSVAGRSDPRARAASWWPPALPPTSRSTPTSA